MLVKRSLSIKRLLLNSYSSCRNETSMSSICSSGLRNNNDKTEEQINTPTKKNKTDIDDRIGNLPIITNGSIALKPVKIDSRTVYVHNTCAFDSIFYCTLSAVSKLLHLEEKVHHSQII